MPLDSEDRSELSSVPSLVRDHIPPRLQAATSPPSVEFSYDQFQYSKETDRIGAGGTAVVYRAIVPEHDITIALKQPFPNKTVDRTTITRLLDEAFKWTKVADHPYIANVFDWDANGPPWVAIEYLAGGTLADRIDEMGVAHRLWTAYALADAVAYASGEHGVTHHDLKPQNILFQNMPNGTWDVPKICDWGLARKLIQHDGSISQSTPRYAAPEQFDAILPNTDVGVHTDVYQLGVVCYELLTEKHPAHLRGDVRPPSEHDSSLPSAVDKPILRALSHDRADRFEHPIVFRQALEAVVLDALGGDIDSDDQSSSHSQPTGLSHPSNTQQEYSADNESTSRIDSSDTPAGNNLDVQIPEITTSVIGCGTAGSQAVQSMAEEGIHGANLIAADTDVQHLVNIEADTKILMGQEKIEGRGAGSLPQVGEEAAIESQEEIQDAIDGSGMVFVTAGLGGGTGTGSAPVVAKAARESGALTIAIVTMPFTAEGEVRRTNAEAGLERLRDVSDTVIVLPNDRLHDSVGKLPVRQAFKMSDEMLMRAVKGIIELTSERGDLNLADIRTVMENGGFAGIGIDESDSGSQIQESVTSALRSPFLDVDLSDADSVLITIIGGTEMSLEGTGNVANTIRDRVGSNTRLVWGTSVDDTLSTQTRTMIIAVGVGSPTTTAGKESSEGPIEDIDHIE